LLCSAALAQAAVTSDEALYSSLYPYYAEFCAVSQILKKPGFGAEIRGGRGGHAVLYLNGVCRDHDAHYPTLVLCDPHGDPDRQGVGLSVNEHFKNANWVATEGREFFFHGGLAPTDRLTRDAYRQVLAKAQSQGIYDGVQFYDRVFADDMPEGWQGSHEDFKYEISMGTDFAINLARDRYCARVPLDRPKMGPIVQYLNGLNDIYKSGQKDFVWNVVQDNCTHLAHNVLAAVGVWPEWETNQFIAFAAFDFPVPKNEFVNLATRTNDLPLQDPAAIYADSSARADMMRESWLPTEPGALVEIESTMKDNDVYDTDTKLIFYDAPFIEAHKHRFDAILADLRYYDIRANLQYFAELYRRAAAARKPMAAPATAEDERRGNKAWPAAGASGPAARNFAAFQARYDGYIERMSAQVRSQLAALPPDSASVSGRAMR
jgi:hypothetical protein